MLITDKRLSIPLQERWARAAWQKKTPRAYYRRTAWSSKHTLFLFLKTRLFSSKCITRFGWYD